MNLLVDILRGSQRREIIEQGYHEIKTYGAGKEYSFDDWIFLLSQMLHLGLLEIAYDDFSRLRITESGRKVLFENKKVTLALPQPKPKPEEKQVRFLEKTRAQTLKEELFDLLVALRRSIAQQQGMPPYLIFSDATLSEMAEKRPLSDADLMQVAGVGERKLQLYGDAFIGAIRRFVLEKTNEGTRVTGSTYLQTWDLFKQGKSVAEIAEMRNVSPMTVTGHLATMYERGELLDIRQWVRPEQIDIIQGALTLFSEPYPLKEIFEHFEGKFSYDQIRFSIADFRKHRK